MDTPANACLKKILELAAAMLALADAGDAARQDIGCGVLYGVLRDSAYKLKRLAEAELKAHQRQSQGEDGAKGRLTGPPEPGHKITQKNKIFPALPLTTGKKMTKSIK